MNQASTLTELQYQQILGNLAMLSLDPWALPAHANVHDGSAQIQDAGVANLVAFTNSSQTLPGFTGSRTVVEQWGVVPVTEKVELQLMRVAYRRALGYGDELEIELANDIAHEICDQISNSDDITLSTDPTINQQLLKATLAPDAEDYYENYKAFLDVLANTTNQPAREDIARRIDRFQNSSSRVFALDVKRVDESLELLRVSANDEQLISTYDRTVFELDISHVKDDIPNPAYNPNVPESSANPKTKLRTRRASPVVREARRQIKEFGDDIDKIPFGWFSVGCKKDIPPNACYVGRFRDRYAWVCPGEGSRQLAEFTAKILDFSTIIKERTVLTTPGGPRFTPSGNR